MGGTCWPTGATGPQARPASGQERFLKRQLSLPVSMISQWWVRRSSSAVVILGVAEDRGPLTEGEIGGDDGGGSLVEPAHEVEEKLPAGLGEGQVAELVEDDEVAADELVCGAALAPGAEFGLEVVDQVDDVVAAASGTLADAGARDGDGEMGLAGAGAADQHDVALPFEEAAAGELLDQGLV